jgi:hypothetical protein
VLFCRASLHFVELRFLSACFFSDFMTGRRIALRFDMQHPCAIRITFLALLSGLSIAAAQAGEFSAVINGKSFRLGANEIM